MNKRLSEKLRMQLATLALRHSYAYGREWYSSAQKLDEVLKQNDINDINVYYEYKMPDGKTPQEYMAKLALYSLYINFDLYNADDRWGFQTDFKSCVPNENDRLQIIDDITRNRDMYNAELTEDYKKLIKLNPNLSRLANKQKGRDDILWGAVFGYAPDDIGLYVSPRHMEIMETIGELNKQAGKLGLPSLGVMEPEKAKKIIADVKRRKYLERLALAWSPFGSLDGKWDSSAKKLEDELAAKGIKMKLYYKYALPENMTPQEFMIRIAVLHLCADSEDSFWIKKDIFFDKSLSLRDKGKIVKYIVSKRKASREKINEYVKFVQHANPELSNLKILNRFHPFDILSGAAFGFGPKEIEYFITDYKGRKTETDEQIKEFGIVPNYVLAPETAKAVLAELRKHETKKNIKLPQRQGIRTI